MLLLNIFWMSSVQGTVSKALLMSTVARSVLYAASIRMNFVHSYAVLCWKTKKKDDKNCYYSNN